RDGGPWTPSSALDVECSSRVMCLGTDPACDRIIVRRSCPDPLRRRKRHLLNRQGGAAAVILRGRPIRTAHGALGTAGSHCPSRCAAAGGGAHLPGWRQRIPVRACRAGGSEHRSAGFALDDASATVVAEQPLVSWRACGPNKERAP